MNRLVYVLTIHTLVIFKQVENITSKYKNKLIILDNASSHRHEKIKELVNKNNKLLYSVPYQHFTNSIEGYFSLLKGAYERQDYYIKKTSKTKKYKN